MAEDVSTEELLRLLLEQHSRELRVALPGRVESYDKAKQRANVRIELQYYLPDPDDNPVPQSHPVLQNVPVAFPQGGGFFCAFPLQKDDPVLVVFCDVPIGAWLQKGSKCEPGHLEMHGLAGAVCYPGLQPSGSPLASTDNANMRLGKDGTPGAQIEITDSEIRLGQGASKKAARGGDTLTASAAFATWAHAVEVALTAAAGGTPTPTTSFATGAGLTGGLGSINDGSCSTKVKVED